MMTDRDVHLPVAAQPTIDSIVDYAQTAENGGYNCAWLPETWGRDGVTVLTAMAERTDSIDVGSSILNTYSRTRPCWARRRRRYRRSPRADSGWDSVRAAPS